MLGRSITKNQKNDRGINEGFGATSPNTIKYDENTNGITKEQSMSTKISGEDMYSKKIADQTNKQHHKLHKNSHKNSKPPASLSRLSNLSVTGAKLKYVRDWNKKLADKQK